MKTYTEQEIDSLVKEVQDQLVSPLIKAAQEELAKSEAGKRMESPQEGGNGTEPKAGEPKSDAGNGPRYAAYKAPGKSGSGSPSNPVAKGEQEMKKDDGPPPESSPEGSAGGGASPEATGGADAPPASDASPAPDAAPADAAPAPDASAAPQGDPDQMGMDGQVPDMQVLVQAYQQLMQQSPESFQAHVAALKQVMMGSMAGAQQSSPMDAGSAPAAMPPADAGSAGGMPPPAMKTTAPMSPPPPQAQQPMAMSEKESSLQELAKAQDEKIQLLEKQMGELLGLVEVMVTHPKRKSITSLQEYQYIAKSEGDAPDAKKLTKSEIRTKLEQAAKRSDLKKSDQDLVTRYFLQGDVKVEDLEHLLK